MARAAALPTLKLYEAMLASYAVNDRMNQMLLERLDERAWCAKPPGGKARTIAAIFAHMHNVRRKWLRLSAPHLPLPSALDRAHCTPKQARSALAESAARCGEMLAEAIEAAAGPAKEFRFLRDGWAKAWPGGAAMFTYMVVHDAHHRGQVCMLARQLGYPLNKGYEIWAWEKIWRELRLRGPRLGPEKRVTQDWPRTESK